MLGTTFKPNFEAIPIRAVDRPVPGLLALMDWFTVPTMHLTAFPVFARAFNFLTMRVRAHTDYPFTQA